MISKMNSDSKRCTPSRWLQETPVGPSSVIPVWSKAWPPSADSIAARVEGMLAPGSPAWMLRRRCSAMPSAAAVSAKRKA